MSAPASRKYTPGPGAYASAAWNTANRHGRPDSPAFTFGARCSSAAPQQADARQLTRPAQSALRANRHMAASTGLTFGKGDVMTRYSYGRSKPSNDPHWNPHAQYNVVRCDHALTCLSCSCSRLSPAQDTSQPVHR